MTTTSNPPTLRVGFLVFPDFEPIDVWGPVEAFSIARFIGTGYTDTPRPFEIVFISNELSGASSPAPVRAMNGPRVAPDYFRDQAATAGLHMLFIPGGQGVRTLLGGDGTDALLDWVRTIDTVVPILGSICTGAAILAAAGVLDGQPAATNHASFAWVTSFGPRVKWDNLARWVDAGRHVTAAGVSAGTDMAFHMVDRLCGRAVAEQAVLSAEYDWHRDPYTPIFYPQGAVVPTSR